LPSFNLLQNFGGTEHTILFYAFDLPILAGTDLRPRPLEQRRALPRELIPTLADPVRHSETFDVPAAQLLATIRQQGLEGIVAKRRTSTYRSGDRSGDWVKQRANRGQELVIGDMCPARQLSIRSWSATTKVVISDTPHGFAPDSFRPSDRACSLSSAVCRSRGARL
jgi:ATP-dependent DNA ligase